MRRSIWVAVAVLLVAAVSVLVVVERDSPQHNTRAADPPVEAGPKLGALTVLPDDGRRLYLDAIDRARRNINIEICVLEDPEILEHLQKALQRRVFVRALVDRGKYDALASERTNLARYLTAAGGELKLSNPIFPRSFPKVMLIDGTTAIYGSACLDSTTFAHYRDFAQVVSDPDIVTALQDLLDTDWMNGAAPGLAAPAFAPTPELYVDDLIVGPVNASAKLAALYQSAGTRLDVYTELLGNRALESELVAAVKRGVRVRLITPVKVNGATSSQQALQAASIAALAHAGVRVHVSGPDESAPRPYMHARAAIVDGRESYLGSISLSPDSATVNREVGLITRDAATVAKLSAQFVSDYETRTAAP